MSAFDQELYPYSRQGDQATGAHHPVIIVGAGPVGLTLGLDLAKRGTPVLILDENTRVSHGSRAICFAKRTLEIADRLGFADPLRDKGVEWSHGRVFHGKDEIYEFDLLSEPGHHHPAFINLQQYYVEEYLVERAKAFPDLIDVRFLNKVTDHKDLGDHVQLRVETPEGDYFLEAEWYIACDGAGSATRERMGLSFEGQTFQEQFLIADIEMEQSPFGDEKVPERWFWFDPPFHSGKSALMHMQPDNI